MCGKISNWDNSSLTLSLYTHISIHKSLFLLVTILWLLHEISSDKTKLCWYKQKWIIKALLRNKNADGNFKIYYAHKIDVQLLYKKVFRIFYFFVIFRFFLNQEYFMDTGIIHFECGIINNTGLYSQLSGTYMINNFCVNFVESCTCANISHTHNLHLFKCINMFLLWY